MLNGDICRSNLNRIETFVKSDLDKSKIIFPLNENLEYAQPKTNTGLFQLIDLSPAFLSFLVKCVNVSKNLNRDLSQNSISTLPSDVFRGLDNLGSL